MILDKPNISYSSKWQYWVVNILMVLIFNTYITHSFAKNVGIKSLMSYETLAFCVLTILLVVIHLSEYYTRSKDFRLLSFIYIIYTFFCVYYMFVSPQIPREVMTGVPIKNDMLWRDIFLISGQVICAPTVVRYFDSGFFAKSIVIISLFFLPYYFFNMDTSFYILYAMSDVRLMDYIDDFKENGLIEPFCLSHVGGICVICSFYLLNENKRNGYLIRILLIISLFVGIYTIIIAGKRGPVLMLILTFVIYYYFRSTVSLQTAIISGIIIIFIALFADSILSYLSESKFASGLIDRFDNTIETGGSNRFGDSDTEYNNAINQIIRNPITGTYFRNTNAYSWTYGHYPHNFFLETIMTFGLLFSIPFYYLIWNALKKTTDVFKKNSSFLLVAMLFLNVFLKLQTSGSIFLSYFFWIPLAMICCLSDTENKEIK